LDSTFHQASAAQVKLLHSLMQSSKPIPFLLDYFQLTFLFCFLSFINKRVSYNSYRIVFHENKIPKEIVELLLAEFFCVKPRFFEKKHGLNYSAAKR